MALRRILCVAEKNAVAKGIAGILGRGHVINREGFSKFNKIYQVDYNYQGVSSILIITSVSGHLMGTDFPPNFKHWELATCDALFTAPIRRYVPDNFADIARTLRREASGSDMLIVWTDCDREGEHIGGEIVTVCQEARNGRSLEVWRARFSEVTPRAISRAIETLVRLDQRQIDAVDTRQELDLRIGAAFTRLQTLTMRPRFGTIIDQAAGGPNAIISYGSCQFPTLGFVVDRYREIENFVPEPFWRLVLVHHHPQGPVEFHWSRVRLFEQSVAVALFDACRESNEAHVTSVEKKQRTKYRPVALDTVEFEKLAVRKLKLNAKAAMEIAEKLYTKGFVSYPRTETNIFPKSLDLDPLVAMQAGHPTWGAFAAAIQRADPRNGTKTDEAHPPIHPTKATNSSDLSADEKRVYELITRHFLACVSRNAVGDEVTAKVTVGAEEFSASGLTIRDHGYLEVYPYEKWSNKKLPPYAMGERLTNFNVDMRDGVTEPPKLLTEADLIALMEKHGIGTDATHAEHIDKIQRRLYVEKRSDGTLCPGFLGLALVDAYNDMGYAMAKPGLRATLEDRLKQVCDGTMIKRDVLAEQLVIYRDIFARTEQKAQLFNELFHRHMNSDAARRPPNQPVARQAPTANTTSAPAQPRPRGARPNSRRGR